MDGGEAAAVKSNVAQWPGTVAIQQHDDPTVRPPQTGWFKRRLLDVGILAMADEPARPPGFFVNATSVICILALCLFIGGLFIFAWNTAYQMGQKDTEMRLLQERLAIAEKKAEQADTKATYAVAGRDEDEGHKPTGTKPKEEHK